MIENIVNVYISNNKKRVNIQQCLPFVFLKYTYNQGDALIQRSVSKKINKMTVNLGKDNILNIAEDVHKHKLNCGGHFQDFLGKGCGQ